MQNPLSLGLVMALILGGCTGVKVEAPGQALLSREEMATAEDMGDYYRVPADGRDLNYGKYVEQGEVEISDAVDYNSHNTDRLDVAGMKALLMKLRFMQATLQGELVEAEE